MWGDPHLITTDGLNYTFNGHGEYWMVNSSVGFEMQARTARVRDTGREEGRATVFTGGVAKDNGSYTYQVELADNRQGMSTLALICII